MKPAAKAGCQVRRNILAVRDEGAPFLRRRSLGRRGVIDKVNVKTSNQRLGSSVLTAVCTLPCLKEGAGGAIWSRTVVSESSNNNVHLGSFWLPMALLDEQLDALVVGN